MKIKILIPVYNDFQSVSKLVSDINSTILNLKGEFSLILVNDASTDKEEISNAITLSEEAVAYFEIAKERFYDASSYDAEDLNSSTYAKELNKIIKQLEELILPGLKKSLEQ